MLTGIHDGLAKDITVTYKPIGDSSVYTPDTSCTYPQNCTNRGLWVVSEHTVTADWGAAGAPDDPSQNPVNKFSYNTRVAAATCGRGWLGFSHRTVTDEQTGATTRTVTTMATAKRIRAMAMHWPACRLASRPLEDAHRGRAFARLRSPEPRRRPRNTRLSDSRNNRAATVHPHKVQVRIVESTASRNRTSSSTLYSSGTGYGYDGFNNLTSQTTSWQGGESRTRTAQYDQNTSSGKYLLSLLRRTDETSTCPAKPR